MLNRAFDRYAEAMRQLESFSVNASHQLRTPLAAIRASAETAICRPQTVEVYEETLSEVLDQTDKLKKVIEQMLLLARIEESAARQFTVIRLCERLREWAEGLRSAADTVGVQLVLVCEGELEVSGNEVLLREAVMNLLENALAHTAAGGSIKVMLQRGAGDRVCLRVEDSGAGIATAERERVFERFYRIDSTTTEGTGLGLAIVRQISVLHGGHVRVEPSTELGGAAFVIELPAKR
jgi:two-component system sensor histidine kinase TctE